MHEHPVELVYLVLDKFGRVDEPVDELFAFIDQRRFDEVVRTSTGVGTLPTKSSVSRRTRFSSPICSAGATFAAVCCADIVVDYAGDRPINGQHIRHAQ